MCGRYVDPDEAALERFWKIDRNNWNPFNPPRYNVAPTLQVPIITLARDGETEIFGVRWGLIPQDFEGTKLPEKTFNARSEEAAWKPTWRDSFRSMRCIMPARGWYEWNEKEKARNPSGRLANQPYYHYQPGENVIAIAGLWSIWQPVDARPIFSCALLTRDAAPSVAHVHHRMPVILKPEYYSAWIDPTTPPAEVKAIIDDAVQEFACHRVSTRVNSSRAEGPELIHALPDNEEISLQG